MNETGTKITTRLRVVASTARPISAVAARAASRGGIFFSSTKRKMFSSTTMASSMTMPTISTSASMVTLRSEEHTSELQSPCNLVCRLLLEKKNRKEHKTNEDIKLL